MLVVPPSLYGQKIFRLYRNNPSHPPAPCSPRFAGRAGGDGEEGCGRAASLPAHTPIPLFPPPHAAERRGEGARGWGCFAMDRTAELGRKILRPYGQKIFRPHQAEKTFAWLLRRKNLRDSSWIFSSIVVGACAHKQFIHPCALYLRRYNATPKTPPSTSRLPPHTCVSGFAAARGAAVGAGAGVAATAIGVGAGVA